MLIVKSVSPFLGNLKSLAHAVETPTLNTSDKANRIDGSFMVEISALFTAGPRAVNRKQPGGNNLHDFRHLMTTRRIQWRLSQKKVNKPQGCGHEYCWW